MNLRLAVTHLAALSLLLLPLTGGCSGKTAAKTMAWKTLEPGLEFAEFESPRLDPGPGAKIRVLRADPKLFTVKLLTAAADAHPRAKTPRQWVQEASLVAAINAAMYQADHITSVSLMKSGAVINNPRVSKDKSVLAFDPLDSTVPPLQIIDREHQDFETLRRKYSSLVQSIRMLSLDGQNVWEQQLHNRWSIAAVGIDKRGRILFIHSRSPNTVHDLIDMLLTLPLDLKNAMYTEGGPEAQMFVKSGTVEYELTGALDAGLQEGFADQPWPIPNVLGLSRKSAP